MKKRMFQIFILMVSIILLAFVITQWKPEKVQAALGNQGIPVRCYNTTGGLSAGTTTFLTCVTPVSPSFVSSQRVPAGYFFLVTDVFVTPLSGGTGNTPVSFYLFDAYATSGRASSYTFRSIDGASYGEHFNLPLYVLTEDHRLEVQAFNANAASFDIRITGMLVNNVSYLPAIFSNP